MDKYQIIDYLITKVDALSDARGVDRCVLIVDIVQRLAALKNMLGGEDKGHDDTTE